MTVAFGTLIYGVTFFTVSPDGLRLLVTSSMDFFNGAVIPLPFFPERIREVMEILPFAAMQNVALRLYSGSLSGECTFKDLQRRSGGSRSPESRGTAVLLAASVDGSGSDSDVRGREKTYNTGGLKP